MSTTQNTKDLAELQAKRAEAEARLRGKTQEAITAQKAVPELARAAAWACFDLYSKFREISQLRGEALEYARFMDSIDAEAAIALHRLTSGDGNSYSALSVVTTPYGEARARKLLSEIGGHFDYLAGIGEENSVQDTAKFVLDKAMGYKRKGI